jgi:hypothetical protein
MYLARFLKPEDRILYDQGLGKRDVRGVFLAPCYGSKSEAACLKDKIFTERLRSARCIVEHSYGRTKCQWPILNYFKQDLETLEDTYRCCIVFTNIDQEYDNPLRYHRCGMKGCGYCEAAGFVFD